MDRGQMLRDLFDDWRARNRKADLSQVHPDLELHAPSTRLRGEPHRGHAGVEAWIADMSEQFDEWEIRLDETEEAGGDRLLGFGSTHLRGRGSGVVVDVPCAWLVTFEGDLIKKFEVFLTFEDARAAAEL